MILILLISFFVSNSFSYDSGLGVFYYKPYSDILASSDISVVSHIEKNRGSVNSAFLPDITANSVSASFWRDYYGKGSYSFVSGSYKISNNIGFSLSYFGYSSGDEELYLLDGSFDNMVYEKDSIMALSSGLKLTERLNMGFKLKNVRSTLAESYSAKTFSADADFTVKLSRGIIYYIGFENIFGSLKYDEEKESLPFIYKSEIAKAIYLDKLDIKAGIGFKKSEDYKAYSAAFSIKPVYLPFIIDAGYLKENNNNFLSFGASVIVENLYISYAIRYPEIFGSLMQKFSISYFFGYLSQYDYKKKKSVPQKNPKRETPKNEKKGKSREELKNIIIF